MHWHAFYLKKKIYYYNCYLFIYFCPTFPEFPNSVFGEHLRKQVEDRIVFYETGVNPKKNIEIMKLALAEVSTKTVLLLVS